MRTCASSISSSSARARCAAIAVAVALGGCATQRADEHPARPPAEQPRAVVPETPPAREQGRQSVPGPGETAPPKGTQLLSQAVKSYEDADYRSASRQLDVALREPLSPAERASAHKYLAFIACASKRVATCRDEFRKAFAADAAFDLTPAEAGHPTWGPAFRRVKADLAAKPTAKRSK